MSNQQRKQWWETTCTHVHLLKYSKFPAKMLRLTRWLVPDSGHDRCKFIILGKNQKLWFEVQSILEEMGASNLTIKLKVKVNTNIYLAKKSIVWDAAIKSLVVFHPSASVIHTCVWTPRLSNIWLLLDFVVKLGNLILQPVAIQWQQIKLTLKWEQCNLYNN